MRELNLEKSKKIGQLKDKFGGLRSMLGDLQIQLVKQNSQAVEENLGFSLTHPVISDDQYVLKVSSFKCIFLLLQLCKLYTSIIVLVQYCFEILKKKWAWLGRLLLQLIKPQIGIVIKISIISYIVSYKSQFLIIFVSL